MIKTISLIALSVFLAAIPLSGEGQTAAEARTADPRLAKIDSFRVPDGEYRIRTKITQWEGDAIAETAFFDVYVSGPEKSLVIARRYKTEDMRILYVGENMWMLFPETQRPIRITPIQRLLGEASNGDVARFGLSADYRIEEENKEDVDGVPCLKLFLAAARKCSTYGRILLSARASDLRPVKADLYLISGKHAKSVVYDEYRSTGGRPSLARMTIFDRIEPAKRTVFEFSDIEPLALPDRYFNKNYLIHFRDPGK